MKFCVLPFAVFAAVHFTNAGVIITEEAVQSMGAAPGKTQLKITAQGDHARIDVGSEISSIIDSKAGTVTSLMHAQKIAMQLPEGTLRTIKQKTEATKVKPDLKPTGQKETINGFDCEEYKGTIAGMNVSFWVTKNVENQKEILDQLGRLSGEGDPFKAALQSGADFPGIPIRTVLTSPQLGTSTMTVTSIKDENVPASTFEIPSNYKAMNVPKTSNPGGGAPAVPVDANGN